MLCLYKLGSADLRPSMAAEPAMANTPKRLRRSDARRPAPAELRSVAEVHGRQVRDEVSVVGYLLLVDESTHRAEVQNRGRTEAKSVCNLLVADPSGMVQVTVWAEKAEQVHPAARQWLQQAPDGHFPGVALAGLQVAAYRNKTVPALKRLQSTGRSKVLPSGGSGICAIRPPPQALLQDSRALREPGVTTCVRGTVGNMKELVFSQDDIGMRSFELCTEDGWKIPTMLHGAVAEEDGLADGMQVILFFAETKAPLPNRQEEGGRLWLYESGFVLICGPDPRPGRPCRQLRIGHPMGDAGDSGPADGASLPVVSPAENEEEEDGSR